MARIRFHGPAHVLRVAGLEIPRGEEADVPADVAERLLAWEAVDVDVYPSDEPISRPPVEQPPRFGVGSGRAAWAEYAVAIGVPITNDMSRDRIISAVDDALNPEPEPDGEPEPEPTFARPWTSRPLTTDKDPATTDEEKED